MLAHRTARSKFEPPAAAQAASLAESSSASPDTLLTVCEQTGYRDTGPYGEILALGRQFQRRSKFLAVTEIGKTAEGRQLMMWTTTRGPRPNRPTILIQNVVHGGETAGKDATLMLLRDFVLGRYPEWIERCNLLVIPVLNADGHERKLKWNRGNQDGPRELGMRVNAQRINLNRDYIRADAPEMRAWLRMYNASLPHLMIDNHTSNGIDFQYDLTFHIQTRQMLWETAAAWNRSFRRALLDRLDGDGHIAGPYFEIEEPPTPGSTLRLEFRTPGYSWGYSSAQNRPAIVVESHSLKNYRTQVWAHYDFMRHAIDLVCRRPHDLVRSVRSADREVAALAASPRPKRLFLDGELAGVSRPYLFRGLAVKNLASEITGATTVAYTREPQLIPVLVLSRVQATVAPLIPAGYVIPPAWTSVLDLLRLHGVITRPLTVPIRGRFETYRFEDECWDDHPTDGRHRLQFRCRAVRFNAVSSPGSVYVPLDQRAARVALNLLEPAAPESLVRWGFFNTIFDQTEYVSDHVFLPLAERMLRSNAAVRSEFGRRLAAESAFREDPTARLDFFYQRSSYAEKNRKLYPVWRVPKSSGMR